MGEAIEFGETFKFFGLHLFPIEPVELFEKRLATRKVFSISEIRDAICFFLNRHSYSPKNPDDPCTTISKADKNEKSGIVRVTAIQRPDKSVHCRALRVDL